MLALALAAALSSPALARPEPAPAPDLLASANLDRLDLPTFEQAVDGGGQPSLAGLVQDGRERPVALAVLVGESPEQTRVAVETLLRSLGLEPDLLEDGSWRVQTPLGRADIPTGVLMQVGGVDYASLPDLARLLGIRLAYDEAAAAIVADTTWPLAERLAGPPPEDVVRPSADVAAPDANLSYWRTELYATHTDGDTSLQLASDVGGGLAGGFWRARYEEDMEDSRRLRDYAFVRTDGNLRWLLGNQRVNSHPLLGSFELTGAQAAWTNRPDQLYTGLIGYGELVSGRVAPATQLRGDGPPGGIAELIYDGEVVARIAIPLDGRYEFRDLELPRGIATRVQVALYEPGGLGAPVSIQDRSGQASDQLLGSGTMLHYAGFGEQGNPLDPDIDTLGSAGFYEGRLGVLPGLTLDVAAQHVDGTERWLTGLVGSLGRLGVGTAHVARSDGHDAWQATGEGSRGAYFWRALAREEDDGFRGPDLEGFEERYIEAGWRSPRLALGLVGREIDGSLVDEPVRFVKPSLDWYPLVNLSFSARPDLEGNYQYTGRWALNPRTRLSAYLTEDTDRFEVEHRLNDRWRGTFGRVEFQDSARHSLLFSRSRRQARDLGLSIALLESEGHFGYLASLDTELRPGLALRVQAYDDPLGAALGNPSSPVVQLSLVADFTVTPQGLAAGSYRRSLVEQGGVSGQLVAPGEADFGDAGATVWVDGQRRGSIDANGRFAVNELSPGVHRVQVDEGSLPIEMRLERAERWVEVRPGVVTPVQFPMSLVVGFGGQLRDATGQPLAGAELVVLDAAGNRVGGTRTDDWGYYRVDGLAPGRYRLQNATGDELLSSPVELSRDFRLGVDARLTNDDTPR